MKKALVLFVLALVPVVNAALVCDTSVGTAAPPGTLGGFTMSAFGSDPQPTGYTPVDGVDSPGCGRIMFSPLLAHTRIGEGWATWSHGYAGDVYYTNGATSATVSMPAGVTAFYLYAEPNPFSVYTMTATANDGTSCSADVDGAYGAAYFGFYGTAGTTLGSVTVTSAVDFAIGEFGICCGGAPTCPCDIITQVKAICTARGTLIAIVKATGPGTCTVTVNGGSATTVSIEQGRRGYKGLAIFRGVASGTVCLPECPSIPCGSC
jgi:hypothetical protein